MEIMTSCAAEKIMIISNINKMKKNVLTMQPFIYVHSVNTHFCYNYEETIAIPDGAAEFGGELQ